MQVRELVFDAARSARADLNHRRERLTRIENASMSSGIPQAISGGKSDPTATVGQALADLDDEYRGIEAGLIAKLVKAQRVCMGVRRCFKMAAGDILEDYYVRGLSWDQVAAINNVGKATAIRIRDAALDWISYVGLERAMSGEGLAEDG